MSVGVRIEYSKDYPATLLGHLDIMGVFQRAMRMAGWPLEFTRGFNPRIKLSSGPPLSLGISSTGEYLDIYLRDKMTPYRGGLLKDKLTAGLKIISVDYILEEDPGINALIQGFVYQITDMKGYSISELFKEGIVYEKNGKFFVLSRKESGNIPNPAKVTGVKDLGYRKIETLFREISIRDNKEN